MPVSIRMEVVVICVYSGLQELNVNAQQGWSCLLTRRIVSVSTCKLIHNIIAKGKYIVGAFNRI